MCDSAGDSGAKPHMDIGLDTMLTANCLNE